MENVPKVFSKGTLEKFEAASASIPLRQIDRAFAAVDIRLGADPGGPEGTRRMQFRRYVASVDQDDPQQLLRLGEVLGTLIDEVATSKQDFLVKAAESDGFVFADGVFRPAPTAPHSFAVTRVEDFASIDDRGRRLQLLANDRPQVAIDGAKEIVESVCRIVLRLTGEPAPKKVAKLAEIAKSTLEAIESPTAADLQLGAVVARLGDARDSRHARLAVGIAVAFAGFIAETYVKRSEIPSAPRQARHDKGRRSS